MSVPVANVRVACCHKFLVIMEHLAILPKKANEDLIFASVVVIGISVILIDISGVNLAIGVTSSGTNVVLSISGIGTFKARSKSSRVVKLIRTIFFVVS